MSPVPTATPEQSGSRTITLVPYPAADLLLSLAKEIVVDWQMPSDAEQKR